MIRRPAILDERRWLALVTLVVLALGQAATMVVTAFATRDVFMVLRDGGADRPDAALMALALAGIALCVLRALEGRIGEGAGQSYAAAIRHVLFRHVTRMPFSAMAERRMGALALRYVGDLAAFKGWIARGVARLISASITLPAAMLVLYILHPMLFWAALGPLAAVLTGIWLLARPLGAAHSDLRTKRARLAAAMAERLPQGISLRRSGRVGTELRALSRKSRAIAEAGVHREGLAAMVRALPDAGAGVAAALCLWVCVDFGLGMPDAVAALTALALIVWPLRHLADVADRRRAFVVARDKLDTLLAAPRLPTPRRVRAKKAAPAIGITGARLSSDRPFDLRLARGTHRRLAGPSGSGKSTLLRALAGLDMPPDAETFEVLGAAPEALRTGTVLYLGAEAPRLRGSLRREVTMGLGSKPADDAILAACEMAGLRGLVERLGGIDGMVAEGRRNLTATERARVHLVRGLLSRPALALVDADEIALQRRDLCCLLDHFETVSAAALVATADPEATLRLGQAMTLGAPACPLERGPLPAA